MSSNATWEKPASFSILAPEEVTSVLSGAKTVIDSASSVMSLIESILDMVSPFMSGSIDIMSTALGAINVAIGALTKDLFALGGGYIVIHPWNRKNKNITYFLNSKGYPSIGLHTMTPRETFAELKASFANVNDPFRPKWTKNNIVAGWGLLLTVSAPIPFVNLTKIMGMFTDFSNTEDFLAIGKNMEADLVKTDQDLRKQFGETKEDTSYMSNLFNKNNSKGTKTENNFLANLTSTDFLNSNNKTAIRDIIDMNTGNEKDRSSKTAIEYILEDNFVSDLHWQALSIENFTFFKTLMSKLDYMMKSLQSICATVSSALTETIKALIKRVKVISSFITEVYNTLTPLISALGNENSLYIFTIPQSVGGVDYLMKAIDSSITAPTSSAAISLSKAMDTNNFSALFFAAASTGTDLNAWWNMYSGTLTDMDAKIAALSVKSPFKYTVSPIMEGKVFKLTDKVTLTVLCPDDKDSKPVFFQYTITNAMGMVVASNVNGNIYYRTNTSKYALDFNKYDSYLSTLSGTKEYTLKVEVFYTLKTFVSTYEKKFTVINPALMVSSTVSTSTPTAVSTPTATSTTSFTNNNDVTVLITDSVTTYTDDQSTSTTSVDPVQIGYETYELPFDAIPSSVVTNTTPVQIAFSPPYSGRAFMYRRQGDPDWIGPLALPFSIVLIVGIWEYITCIDGVWSEIQLIIIRAGDPTKPVFC